MFDANALSLPQQRPPLPNDNLQRWSSPVSTLLDGDNPPIQDDDDEGGHTERRRWLATEAWLQYILYFWY